MNKRILLTRPRASSERWAHILSLRGFDCLIEPLLTIEPLPEECPEGDFQAVLLTSANAPDALEVLRPRVQKLFSLPCFCVGASTASAARAVGFATIIPGASDSAAVARLVVDHITDKSRPLLHIAGDVVDGKARSILEQHGLTLKAWTVYRAVAAENIAPETLKALKNGDVAAMPVFSPRSARVLASLIEKNKLSSACSQICAIALSQPVADVLQNLPWRSLRVAAVPSEEEVLACLEKEFSQSDEMMMSTEPSPLLPSAKKKKGSWLLKFLVLSLMGVLIFLVVYERGQRLRDDRANSSPPTVVDAPSAGAPVMRDDQASQETSDTSALNERVTALENELAQVKKEKSEGDSRRLVAALAAFNDLREASRQGTDFSAPLLALRQAMPDEPATAEPLKILETYAGSAVENTSQLNDDLARRERQNAASQSEGDDTSLSGRLKKILKPLITVRPAHDQQFVDLESALKAGDSQAAMSSYAVLPSEIEKSLGDFGTSLQARDAVDQAIKNIDTHFINMGHQP